jgi:hypothetical protein
VPALRVVLANPIVRAMSYTLLAARR